MYTNIKKINTKIMSEGQIYLTQEKLDELKKELDYLKNTKRREVAQRIHDAKELGDLSENAEYAEAKDNQAWTEGRINEIDDIIKRGVLIERNGNGNRDGIGVGSKIKVQNGSLEKDLEIVGSQECSPADGKISNESPLGKAFIGKKSGEEVEVETPKGVVKYKIVGVG